MSKKDDEKYCECGHVYSKHIFESCMQEDCTCKAYVYAKDQRMAKARGQIPEDILDNWIFPI